MDHVHEFLGLRAPALRQLLLEVLEVAGGEGEDEEVLGLDRVDVEDLGSLIEQPVTGGVHLLAELAVVVAQVVHEGEGATSHSEPQRDGHAVVAVEAVVVARDELEGLVGFRSQHVGGAVDFSAVKLGLTHAWIPFPLFPRRFMRGFG